MDEAELQRQQRLQLLNAAGVLMDLCGLSVHDALVVRAKLSPEQMARLRQAGVAPIAAGRLAAHAVLDEVLAAERARLANNRRRRRKSVKAI